MLRWIGTVHRERGDRDLAADLYETSLAVAETNGLAEHTASALNCLAVVEQFRGHLETSETLYTRARAMAEEAHDERLAAMIDQNLGMLANIRGDLEAALARYRSALERLRRLGDDLAAAWVLNNMGMAYVDLKAWGPAEICFDEAFELADRLRDTGTLGSVELNRAELQLQRGDHEWARESCDRAFEIWGRLGSDYGLAETYKFYGILFRETGKPHLAQSHFALAAKLAAQCEDRLLEAESYSEWALVHLGEQRNRDALECLNRAQRLFTELQARREILDLDSRLDRLEETYLRVTRAWGESIESKDRYTAGHCQRVADFACMLAEAAGFEGRDLNWLRMGGFLHDVGKTAVPEEVLNKPGALTAEEWAIMKSHTVVGDQIVAELNFPWDIRPVVRNHHERWDGTGYPDGLAGEAIPLTARILCVADVYDALTSTRSYRPALPQSEALRIMERDAGRILDPELFRVFRQLLTERASGDARPRSLAAPISGT
ncbi:MAG: tetratricopeptide repeat protein [Gemmatimonadetes bacterium]|nr:tetratricopeptide repeat protein [Gemmatimonadota bacterium]